MTKIDGYSFLFAGEKFIARPSGALWWPARRTVVVADMHLGRSERYARRGGALLPPFEVLDTVDRLRSEIEMLDPACVVSLGDAFDDDAAVSELSREAMAQIGQLARGRDWIWIAGNHDPATVHPTLPGDVIVELPGPIALRHKARSGPDISGHMHPSTRLAGRRWRCYVVGPQHLILPAFGTYTGGLDISDPAFGFMREGGIALACSDRVFVLPMPLSADLTRLQKH